MKYVTEVYFSAAYRGYADYNNDFDHMTFEDSEAERKTWQHYVSIKWYDV